MFNKVLIIILLFGIFAFADNVPSVEAKNADNNSFSKEELNSFSEITAIISENFIEEVDKKELYERAVTGMVASLDEYSQFLSPAMFQEIKIHTSGKFCGLGVEVYFNKDFLEILSFVKDSPAFLAGLKIGDNIVAIDGKKVSDLTREEAILMLRGPAGTEVVVGVTRKGEAAMFDVAIKRQEVFLESVEDAKLFENGIGYIRISSFATHTNSDFTEKLKDFMSNGLKALIIDVRNNPGGVLDDAVKILSLFVEKGQKLVTIKSRKESNNFVFISADAGVLFKGPLAVLINKSSASSAEIIAGAIKDIKRGIVIGETSYGKGSVQSLIPLADGAALKLTTARYYLPSDELIEGKGITPDIKVIAADDSGNKEDVVLEKAVRVVEAMLLDESN